MSSQFGFPRDSAGGDIGREFDSFRQKRQNRRLKTEGLPGTAVPKNSLQAEIEQEESRALFERQIAREVQDFVEQTTRIAAQILEGVSKDREQQHAHQISQEMREFFQSTLNRAEGMLAALQNDSEADGPAVAELEAHLNNLTGQALDAFRAEGSEELATRHMGKDPQQQPLEEAPETQTLHLEESKSEDDVARFEAPPAEQSEAAASLSFVRQGEGWHSVDEENQSSDEVLDEEIHFDPDGMNEMEPLGEEYSFIESEEEEDAPKASGAWRAKKSDEDETEVEEIQVDTGAEELGLEDGDEDPFSAVGTAPEAMPEGDPFQAPSLEAPAPEPEPDIAAPPVESSAPDQDPFEASAPPPMGDDFPPFFAKWRDDPARLKKALTVMVKNGLMSPEEARDIFSKR